MNYIDLRSDTVTEPTRQMLEAMIEARVGDDVYGDDPTVKQLDELSAKLMGKQSSLFVPSGTFGNQLAIMTHTSRGDEIIIGQGNHIVQHEVGAPAFLSGVQLRTIEDLHGHIRSDQILPIIREEDIHYPRTGLICTENAHSDGTVLGLEEMDNIYRLASAKNIPVHLDGARIFNAAVFLGVDAAKIAVFCDSVMFCLSKGLCCPIGSLLCGSNDFINQARKFRKLMGGGMRQIGFIAACGLIALNDIVPLLDRDHQNAGYLAEKLSSIDEIEVEKERLDINMVFFSIRKKNFSQADFINYLYKNRIKINPVMNGLYRLVTHFWISKKDIDLVSEKIYYYFNRKAY